MTEQFNNITELKSRIDKEKIRERNKIISALIASAISMEIGNLMAQSFFNILNEPKKENKRR